MYYNRNKIITINSGGFHMKSLEDYELSYRPPIMVYKNYVARKPGIILKSIMQKENLTIKELSEKSKISEKTISDIYNNQLLPNDYIAEKISLALHQDKDFFSNCRIDYVRNRRLILDHQFGLNQ